MPQEFEVRKEITLDATPEQVWEAIATGPGIDSWFMGHNEVEPGEGGRTRQTVGGHTEEATITGWDPGKRLAFRTGTMAFEYLIEGRDQGSTVLRLVHSGFLGDDWEAEYEAMAEGWDMYLHKLAQYLIYFRGRTATVLTAMRPQAAPLDQAWATLKAGLGLPDAVAVGDQVRLTPAGLAPIDGVVDYLSPHFLGVRGADGLYRFIHGGHDTVVVGHQVFAAATDRAASERAWQSWLDGLFPR